MVCRAASAFRDTVCPLLTTRHHVLPGARITWWLRFPCCAGLGGAVGRRQQPQQQPADVKDMDSNSDEEDNMQLVRRGSAATAGQAATWSQAAADTGGGLEEQPGEEEGEEEGASDDDEADPEHLPGRTGAARAASEPKGRGGAAPGGHGYVGQSKMLLSRLSTGHEGAPAAAAQEAAGKEAEAGAHEAHEGPPSAAAATDGMAASSGGKASAGKSLKRRKDPTPLPGGPAAPSPAAAATAPPTGPDQQAVAAAQPHGERHDKSCESMFARLVKARANKPGSGRTPDVAHGPAVLAAAALRGQAAGRQRHQDLPHYVQHHGQQLLRGAAAGTARLHVHFDDNGNPCDAPAVGVVPGMQAPLPDEMPSLFNVWCF